MWNDNDQRQGQMDRKQMQSDDNSSHHPKGSGELKKNETVLPSFVWN
jgi:hypothetical protein